MTQIDALTAALTAAGLQAKAWKNSRIYLNNIARDINAYITLDDPESEPVAGRLFDGCALHVYSGCTSQTAKWRANRAKQVKHDLMVRLYGGGEGVAAYLGAPCASWQDVIL